MRPRRCGAGPKLTHATTAAAQVASNGADVYLADHNAWVPAAPMPEPRFRLDAAFANGFVYAFGGEGGLV